MNLYTLLAHTARRFPAVGAVYLGSERVWTYAELDACALSLAAGLQARGLAGERIVIASENQPAYLPLLFGVWAAGAVVVPVNAKLHVREMQQIIDDAEARLVLASPGIAGGLADAPGLVVIGSPAYEALFEAPLAQPADTAPDALAWLFYTSGTTGRSKGAMLSHRNLMAMTLAHLADIETITENDSQVHAAPMSHGSGLYIPAYVARGARQVLPASGSFDPAEFIELASLHPGCGAFLAPTVVQRLRVEAERSGRRPTRLRSIVYGGGPMYVEDLKKALAVFGPVFAQVYGQGESPMTITGLGRSAHAGGDAAVLGSVGWARTGCEVAVVDADGRALPAGEVGEIVCRGDVVMQGYWRNAAGTAEALRGGWLWTGDMGTLDASGCLTLRDRSKDLVISGGSNVYPREVEEVLLTHPGVAEVCVVGQPDAEWGELVVAFVVAASSGVDAAQLDQHCLARIARFKRPRSYHFVEALPKNNYGKVLRRELRNRLRGGG
ncbi:MAG TPA: AMP-binding protein [Ramlibacter sp.]|nr:AMP-binding protein [Ramlibacter sp.]